MGRNIITTVLITVFIFSSFGFMLLAPTPVFAGPDELLWGGYKDAFQASTGLGSTDPRIMIAELIRVVLSFLGILAVMIIILAGFKWMVSAGDEEKAGMAKGMITSGVIGLVVVVSSFGVSQFIITSLFQATGATG